MPRCAGAAWPTACAWPPSWSAAVIVGGVIGWGLDWWLGTKPWLFLLFFVLGFAAGVLNVVRAYERMQKEITARTGGRIGHSVPDDED